MKPLALLLLCSLAGSASAEPDATPPKKPITAPIGSSLDRPSTGARPKPKPPKPLTLPPKPAAAATPPATPPAATGLPAASAARGLSFEARQTSSGGSPAASTSERTFEGSLSKIRVNKSQTTLEIQVRNLSREADTAHFEWFFLAKGVAVERTYVWDKGERDVPVPPASQKKETVESEELASTITRTTTGSTTSSSSSSHTSEKKTGARPYGWIVRMSVGGKLVKVQSSNGEIDKIARDPAQFDQLLKQKPPKDPNAPDP